MILKKTTGLGGTGRITDSISDRRLGSTARRLGIEPNELMVLIQAQPAGLSKKERFLRKQGLEFLEG